MSRGAVTRDATSRGAATLAVLALIASLLQLGAVPALFLGSIAAPLLPVALIAAWTMARGERELWPALLVVAAVLGVASSERVGWFLLALLPAAGLSAVIAATLVSRRLALAPAAAALGALAYLAVLATAGGGLDRLPAMSGSIAAAGAWTALVAAVFALVLWPLQPRPGGLFE
jgi:hypothetical protein